MNTVKKYSLKFESASSVYTGMGIAGLVDRFVIRNGSRKPVIPGSTVKGRWRFFAERLARSIDHDDYTVHSASQPFCTHDRPPCTICRLFGSPLQQGSLAVGPAQAVDEAALARVMGESDRGPHVSDAIAANTVRPGVALSRRTRTAARQQLFFDEVVPAATFSGQLRQLAAISSDEWQFLKYAGQLVDAVGSRKASGRGGLAGGIVVEN